MRRIRALLFDLDGTLADTASANHLAYSRALREAGADVEPSAVARAAAGRHWSDFLPGLLGGGNVWHEPEQIARRKGELYRQSIGSLRLNEPLLALLSSSRTTLKSALVTTASRLSVDAILEHHRLKELFDVVVTGDDVSRHKPDPEAYLCALSRLRLSPLDCVAFEDSDAGIASADAAGVPVIRITF